MMDLVIGDRVKHPTQHEAWGKGEVVEISSDGKITVFFAKASRTIKTKGVTFEKLSGAETADDVLDHQARLTKRAGKSRSARIAPAIGQLKEAFLSVFPAGFEDPEFLSQERAYKLAAGERLREKLDEGSLVALLDAGEYQQICQRARAVIHATNIVDHHETIVLDKSTASSDAKAAAYGRALRDLLYGSGSFQTRFGLFAAVLEELGGAKWPIATYFPFLAFPDEHFFLKPEATKFFARSCGFELNYRPQLNWRTYETLLRFADVLEEKIADLKPRDRIDLQSFVWRVWKKMV